MGERGKESEFDHHVICIRMSKALREVNEWSARTLLKQRCNVLDHQGLLGFTVFMVYGKSTLVLGAN